MADQPAAKRQRMAVANKEVHPDTLGSSILELRPELLRKVRSFLTLRDALVLRSSCRRLHNDEYETFRYSHLFGWECLVVGAEEAGHMIPGGFTRASFLGCFLERLIEHESASDNAAPAVSVLLQDGRFFARVSHLHMALKKDSAAIANVLQRDERVRAGIKMCHICSANIGAYECVNDGSSCRNCSKGNRPKYCRSCVLTINTCCKFCNEYVCPHCIYRGKHHSCVECHAIICYEACSTEKYLWCLGCDLMKCRSCIQPGEEWTKDEDDWDICPDCRTEEN